MELKMRFSLSRLQHRDLLSPIRSANGFTILEAIIAAAAGLIVLGGLMSGITAMSTIAARSTVSSNSSDFEQELAEALKSGDICSSALAGKTLDISNFDPQTVAPITLSTVMTGGQAPRDLSENTSVDTGVTIEKLRLAAIDTSVATPVDVATSSGPQKLYLAILHVQTRKTSGTTAGSLSRPIDIPLKILVGAGNVIQKCNTDSSEARSCSESGGKWDPTAAPANRCTPQNSCQFAGTYSDTGFTGSYPNELTGQYNCPDTFGPVRSGTMTIAARTSKYGIGNSYVGIYTCVKCGGSFAAQASVSAVPGMVEAINYAPEAGIVLGTSTAVTIAATTAAVPTPTPVPVTNTATTCDAACRADLGCFIAGTQVTMGDGAKKAIEDVKIGDQILSYNELAHSTYVSTVVATLHHPSTKHYLYDVFVHDGKNFVANSVHWVYVVEAGTYLHMSEIYDRFKAGQPVTIIDESGATQRVDAIRNYVSTERVYNLHVDGIKESRDFENQGVGHNYFAGGVLVHNMLYKSQTLLPAF